MAISRRPLWPVLAGVLAGAVGAVVAAVVSLPLRSPDDLIANTASVTLAALAIGIVGGAYWRRIHDRPDAARQLLVAAGVGFAIAVVVLIVLEAAVLSRFISFGVPLAAIIFGAVGLLTPRLTEMRMPTWTPLAAVVVAILMGGLLAGVGDGVSGDLSLDDLPATATPFGPVPTAPPATTVAPAAGPTDAPETTVSNPGGLLGQLAATEFTFTGGTATWSVPETFLSSGLSVTAVGRSENLEGTIDLQGPSRFSVDLTTFVSDQERRDSRVRNIFAANPLATFTTTELTLPDTYTEGEVLTTEVSGELTVNGVTRNVTWAVEARVTGTQLDVTGELDIVLTDYDVTPPSVGGFVAVEDSARLEVLFSAMQ